jgi:hypothetical protein
MLVRKKVWLILGSTALAGLFSWQTLREIQLFIDRWRILQDKYVILQIQLGIRVLVMLALTASAAAGPVAFIIIKIRTARKLSAKRVSKAKNA